MISGAPPVRVLLVEDHALFRRGLRRLLEEFGFEVVGEASNGEAGVKLVDELRPDVVVMDLHMPIMQGVEATRLICGRAAPPRVLVLTMSLEDDDVVEAVLAGASGYLIKDADAEVIADAVAAAAQGEVTISPAVAGSLVDRVRAGTPQTVPGDVTFTDRELEVLRLLAEGLDNPEIAARLFVSPSTVKNQVSSILEKLGVDSRVQAAVHAVRAGIV